MNKKTFEQLHPDNILSYFKSEWFTLIIITITGIIYNIGMIAGPFFEGQLAQMLVEIIHHNKQLSDMISLALIYVSVIFFVQMTRYIKRLYVRKFANNINRKMKHILYNNLIHQPTTELLNQNIGSLMTKAILDVDTCVEGMRKFTTEIFDTGVVMIAYLILLFHYDWKLALISCLFPPFAYLFAQKLKKTVTNAASNYKQSAGELNNQTFDRMSNALIYRTQSVEPEIRKRYEKQLTDYEQKAVHAGILETSMQPIYQIISMISVIFIIWFGAKNINGTGWSTWNIASFTTFLSCFMKLAVKSSKSAKLFNAVHKASVSWQRIQPYMSKIHTHEQVDPLPVDTLTIENLSFHYPSGKNIFEQVNLHAKKGEIIGITGPVACGKSTLGKVFLSEYPYQGNIYFNQKLLSECSPAQRYRTVGYMGHNPELLSDTIEENIQLGENLDITEYLQAVCIEQEIKEMPNGAQTKAGSQGMRLSGGQQARIALARTLYHQKPLIILDDPFSALDKTTENQIFQHLKEYAKDSIILLISHRLYVFPELDQVLWMENGTVQTSTHNQLMIENSTYQELYTRQMGGQ